MGYAKQKGGLREGTFTISGLKPHKGQMRQRESANSLLAGGITRCQAVVCFDWMQGTSLLQANLETNMKLEEGFRWANTTFRNLTTSSLVSRRFQRFATAAISNFVENAAVAKGTRRVREG